MWMLAVLLAAVFSILPIAAFVLAIRALTLAKRRPPDDLERRVSELEIQTGVLRRAVKTLSAADRVPPAEAPAPAPAVTPPSTPPPATSAPWAEASTGVPAEAVLPQPSPPVTHPATEEAPGRPPVSAVRSLEETIGARWATWVGVIALLFAAAFFLQWSIKNEIIGPRTQVTLGLLAGVGLLVAGLAIRRRSLPYLSAGLSGGGLAILYLSLWAAFARYEFIGAGVAFAAMFLVTVAGSIVAVVASRQAVAVLAVLGGLLTPILISTGESPELVLLGYLVVLEFLVLAVARFRSWPALNRVAWLGMVLLLTPVVAAEPDAPHPFGRLALLTALFLLFLWVPLARAWAERAPVERLDLGLVLGNAVAYFSAVYATLEHWRPVLEAPWALILGAVYTVVAVRYQERVPRDPATYALHLATGAVLLTLSIPLALDGPWVTMAWAAQGVAFVWVARQVRTPVAPWGALVVLCMAAVRVVGLDLMWFPVHTAVWNLTFLVHLAVVGCFAWAGWLVAKIGDDARSWAGLTGEDLRGFLWVVGAAVLAVLLWREPTGLWPAVLLILEMVALASLVSVLQSRALVMAAGGLAVIMVARVLGEDDALARGAAESLVNLPVLIRIAACAALAVAGNLMARARTVSGASLMARILPASAGVLLLVVLSSGWVHHEMWVSRDVVRTAGAAAADRVELQMQVGLSVLWTLYAAVAVAWGFVRSAPAVRYAALALFGIVILKVFLIDMAELEAVYRIASFFILGLVLLAVSYVYQRLIRSR